MGLHCPRAPPLLPSRVMWGGVPTFLPTRNLLLGAGFRRLTVQRGRERAWGRQKPVCLRSSFLAGPSRVEALCRPHFCTFTAAPPPPHPKSLTSPRRAAATPGFGPVGAIQWQNCGIAACLATEPQPTFGKWCPAACPDSTRSCR